MASAAPLEGDDRCLVDQFAVVVYVPPPLGPYLDVIRRRTAPWLPPGRSHVSVVPPRPLNGNAPAVWRELRRRFEACRRFEVEATEVHVFESSRVIYLEIGEGAGRLRELHELANRGPWSFQDPYPYHPHITLAQQVPEERFAETLERVKALWERYRGPRRFPVEKLHFVQNSVVNLWADLDVVELAADGHSNSLI